MTEKSDATGTGQKIAVIGAGAIGINCALSLQKDGHDVVMLDRIPPGEGCSSGNAGLLARSSFVPLSGPGMLMEIPGWLLDPTGPLAIRWSYLPKLMPWLIRYFRAGKAENIRPVAEALKNLTETSIELYEDLATQAGEPELIQRAPYMYAYESEKAFAKSVGSMEMRREMGVEMKELQGAQIRDLEPALSDKYKYGWLAPDHGFTLDPLALMRALASLFQRRGGTFRQSGVQDVEIKPGGGVRLILDDGDLVVDRVVLAAGAWSRKLAAKLGADVPLDTERGYHVTLPEPGVAPAMPVMSGERKFLATPMSVGLRLAGTVEFGGVDAAPNYKRARALLKHGKEMFPGLCTDNYSEWMGRRPTLPDSLPVIGRAPGSENVLFAFGHQHIGLTTGPETGRIIADLVADRRSNIDLSPYRPDRF